MINFIRTSIYRTFNRSMTVLLLIRGDFYVAQRRRKRGRNNKKFNYGKDGKERTRGNISRFIYLIHLFEYAFRCCNLTISIRYSFPYIESFNQIERYILFKSEIIQPRNSNQIKGSILGSTNFLRSRLVTLFYIKDENEIWTLCNPHIGNIDRNYCGQKTVWLESIIIQGVLN